MRRHAAIAARGDLTERALMVSMRTGHGARGVGIWGIWSRNSARNRWTEEGFHEKIHAYRPRLVPHGCSDACTRSKGTFLAALHGRFLKEMFRVRPIRLPAGPLLTLAALFGLVRPVSAGPDAADLDYFEKRIRPVLVEKCYSCHSAEA